MSTRQSVFAVNNCVLVLGSRGTHIRLKKVSRLLDLCPATQSYSLKKSFMLIGPPARSHVILALKKKPAYWDQGSKPSHIRLEKYSAINFRVKMFEKQKNDQKCIRNYLNDNIAHRHSSIVVFLLGLGWSRPQLKYGLAEVGLLW